MTLHSYDLVVAGDHLGGLAAAALSAKRGKRVMAFWPSEGTVEGERMEYLNAICGGPEKEAGLGRFFHEIGLSPFGPLGDDRIHFRPLSPPLQIILPEHRVNIFQDRVARRWEMEREFGKVQQHLDHIHRREKDFRELLFRFRARRQEGKKSALGRLQDQVARIVSLRALVREAERQEFSDFLASCNMPPGLSEVLAGQVRGVTRLLPSSMPWSVGLRALNVLQGGLFQNASGLSGILNGLKEAFHRFGGESRPLPSLESIDLSRSEGAHLHLSAGGEIKADRVVFDLPLAKSFSYLAPETVKGLQKRRIDQVEERWGFGLMRLTVRRDWLPECMGKYIVIDAGGAGMGSLEGTILVAGQPSERAEEKDHFGIEALGLFNPETGAGKRREVIWGSLSGLMPFLEKSLVGEVVFEDGEFPRYANLDRRWRSLENYYRTGRRLNSFRSRHAIFLRNEEYIGTGLVEGLLSGIRALD